MAINRVRVQIDGTWHQLTYNSAIGKWEGTVTAPAVTSFKLPNGYYACKAEATNEAGTTTTVTALDLAGLQLVVKERVRPAILLTSPGEGAYVTNNKQTITFTVTDEINGSGIKLSTLKLTVDGTVYTTESPELVVTDYADASGTGYQGVFTPTAGLADGAHTFSVSVEDNDGNVATSAARTFTVDTVPPILNITSPENNLVTNTPNISVIGTTNDATSSPVSVAIILNGADQGAVTVAPNGTFSKAITLAEGANSITVTSTDLAGKSSTVDITVFLDTTEPVIENVSITPNPADAGATLVISVEVS